MKIAYVAKEFRGATLETLYEPLGVEIRGWKPRDAEYEYSVRLAELWT